MATFGADAYILYVHTWLHLEKMRIYRMYKQISAQTNCSKVGHRLQTPSLAQVKLADLPMLTVWIVEYK